MTEMNRKAMTAFQGIIVILLMVVTVSVAGYVYMSLTVGPHPPPPTPEMRTGYVAITVTETEPTTLAANTGTSSAYTLWHLKNPGLFPISSKSDLEEPTTVSGATSFTIGEGDNLAVAGGYKQYIVLQAYSGTADYIAMKYMITGVVVNHQENIDLGVDGYPEVLFLLDLTGKPIAKTQAFPTPVTVSMYLTVADVTLSDDNPADVEVSGSGAQSGSGVQNWQITVTTDNTGDSFVIGRVCLTFNDTEAYLTPKALTITAFDGTQTVISSPTSETIGSTSYIYYVPTSGNYRWTYNGLLMYRSSGSNTYVNIGWAYDYSFAAAGSGYDTNVTLYWDVIGPTSNGGTITAYNDAVIIKNAA